MQAESATDVVVARRFRAVTVMLEHPAALFSPGLVARAVIVNLRNRLARLKLRIQALLQRPGDRGAKPRPRDPSTPPRQRASDSRAGTGQLAL